MTINEVQRTIELFGHLWPKCKRTPAEWQVYAERAIRMNIEYPQAEAALKNLKATTHKYPHVAMLLDALKAAQGTPRAVATQSPSQGSRESWGYHAGEMLNANGLTSFEQRVIDDPDFHEFAKKIGRLDAARLKEIRQKAGAHQ